MLVDGSEVLFALLLGFLALSLEEFFLLGRADKSFIEIMVPVKEIILLTATFFGSFEPSTANAEVHVLNKRRISIWLLLKLPLWCILVIFLLEAVGEMFLMAILPSRLYPLESSRARFGGVLVRVKLIASTHIIVYVSLLLTDYGIRCL